MKYDTIKQRFVITSVHDFNGWDIGSIDILEDGTKQIHLLKITSDGRKIHIVADVREEFLKFLENRDDTN